MTRVSVFLYGVAVLKVVCRAHYIIEIHEEASLVDIKCSLPRGGFTVPRFYAFTNIQKTADFR
ncbi:MULTISPECIES: hypothetical protein [unclassified Bartonella]|uniref:hypothetical protein n=1 Tax=unclassified Bartonella TaxID=2645622 RepID=UPI0035D0F256